MTEPTFQAPPAAAEESSAAAADEGKTFTQAELDAIVGDRLKRQKSQFADYDDLKAKAVEFDKLAEASKTDQQKAQEEANRWQTEAERWRGTAVASTVRALAATEFADPDDAVRNIDAAKYVDAGGVIDEQAIKADLDALLAAKPHYRRATEQTTRTPKPNTSQGATNGTPTDPGQLFAGVMQQALSGR